MRLGWWLRPVAWIWRVGPHSGPVGQLCVIPSAVVGSSGLGTSRGPDFGAAPDRGAEPAGTSAARISPPGPEPRTVARSTPNSFASRRALGEVFTPALAAGAAVKVLAGVVAA